MKTDSQKMKDRISARNRMRLKRQEDKMELEDYVVLFDCYPSKCTTCAHYHPLLIDCWMNYIPERYHG